MTNKITALFLMLLVTGVLLTACTVTPRKDDKKITTPLFLLKSSEVPFLSDDLDEEYLKRATLRSRDYYKRLPAGTVFAFGSNVYTAAELEESLLKFLEILVTSGSNDERDRMIKDAFDIYKSIGRGEERHVLFTGYYEPLLYGSLEKTPRYRYPIYRVPDDHVPIDLGQFGDKYRGESIVARIEGGKVVPYYTRKDIDVEECLKGRGLEIAWVDDPIDLFFLHIQGSGTVMLPDHTEIQVSYAHKNGQPYQSIGKFLVDKGKISIEESSLESIKTYLRRHPEEMMNILSHNESYVFFRIVDNGPIGSLNVPVTSQRSIATDSSLFPKGALAFIRARKPVIEEDGTIKKWVSFSRFVLNQDTGGAIKGTARADLFCGKGRDAAIMAGHLKEEGELYFLVKKKE